MRTASLRIATALVLLITSGLDHPWPRRGVLLVPFGSVSADALLHLRRELTTVLKRDVAIAKARLLPASAYEESRKQYLGDALLVELEKQVWPEAGRVLGVIDRDAYAPKLNFILGQARKPGRFAVVALPRLRESFRGRPESAQRFRERMVKVAVHEIGHTFGLAHCTDRACVMHFANSVFELDQSSHHYCRLERFP